jgi:hypothetical protein
MEKAYSADNEDFSYTDVSELLQALADDGELVEGKIYYEADTEQVSLVDYLKAERVLESAGEWLFDQVGEAAEDAYHASEAAESEWDAFVSEWAAKHLTGRYWRCVGRSREIKVTPADVAEHATTIAAALLIAPANAGEPIRVYLDGQPIGTLAELEYRLSEGEIHISTNELV